MKPLDIHTDVALTGMPHLNDIVAELCAPESYEAVYHHSLHNTPMPSLEALTELMARLRGAIFPGYFGSSCVVLESMRYHLSANLDSIYRILAEQIRRGVCFANANGDHNDGAEQSSSCGECAECANGIPSSADAKCSDDNSHALAMAFLQRLPHIRAMLASDVRAAFEGDPAAKTPGETIFCYPSLYVMIHHRIAHELYNLGVPIIPRIISEMAHSHTGIDIHPGAQIDEEFFIDHGTGVVIGETCIIGKHCRLYQGVTLGALSFPKAEDGTLIKGIPRHPLLEDNVTVYAGATILGRVTIGSGSTIGGNVWVTHDVEPKSRVMQQKATPVVK